MIQAIWQDLGKRSRVGLIAGIAGIALLTAIAAVHFLKVDYQVLFSGLSPQDTGAMVAELDKMKVPYRLDDTGTAILVDKQQVHQVRIKLMSTELPLHGAVGFELFNNSDFGMTEFAQKVNYQRALQGEITRTILSLSEIQNARVHLAMPEESLFKRANSQPKASITLTLKQGAVLHPEQVNGIQRLVSAAVAGVATEDVTIVNEHGVALTRIQQKGDAPDSTGGSRLDLKKETETYLVAKAVEVLNRTFGEGQALASVDVTLDMDQVRVTTENVVYPAIKAAQTPQGVVVRERETLRDVGSLDSRVASTANGTGSSSQREVDYAVGKRVEQVVSSPGSIRRIQVVAVVRQPLTASQSAQVQAVVASAVGASTSRGDTIVVQSLATFSVQPPTASHGIAVPEAVSSPPRADEAPQTVPAHIDEHRNGALALLLVGVALLAALLGYFLRRRVSHAPGALTAAQKQVVLARVQAWMRDHPDDAMDGTRP